MAPSGVPTLLGAIKKGVPDVILKRRLNFITIHYLYLSGMTLFWSGIFYAMGGVAYIDSLFFTSGACTQSGLNTINVNSINTGQQVVLYILAMLCNPIAIHTSVVFIRLYWFEKRFKDVVREARQLRRTRSRSRQRRGSAVSEDMEAAQPELGVRGRAIQLLRSTGHRADAKSPDLNVHHEEKEKQIESSETSEDPRQDTPEHQIKRKSSADSLEDIRLPQQMGVEQHIRFLEKQRNPEDDTTLRIPSPREFDRGGRVQSISGSQEDLERQHTRYQDMDPSPEVANAPHVRQHITFNEPEVLPHSRTTARATTFPRIETAKASTMDPTTYDDNGRGRSRTRRNSSTFLRTNTARTMDAAPYLSWQPTVARNSFFVNLTEEQREELGGIEYRALKTLTLILLGYFFGFHLLGIICLTPWIYHTQYGGIVTGDAQGRAWWGIFTAGSAFNDLGFTLTPDSMISFQSATFPMLLMTYLVIIGNTGFPCMLRFTIWAISKCVPVGGGLWEELQFLLDHPRRCFTLLFPRSATWWLFAILVILNGMDLIFFVLLDINDPTVTTLSGWVQFLVGLFQAASTRTAGFAAINLAELHPGIQVSYLIMMYISVFPIAISMRRTNVYEEKSLGIYASGGHDNDGDENDPSYVGAHLRKQLSFDLWYVFLGLFIICIVEGGRLQNTNEYAFTIFSVLFEIVSAYGTVGLSLGYPTTDASFSSQFKVLSKLVIIAMQIRGRHRGLPYELDRAILLPSESLHVKEAREGEKILQRRQSGLAGLDTRQMTSRHTNEGALGTSTSYKSNDDFDSSSGPSNEYQEGPRQRRVPRSNTTPASPTSPTSSTSPTLEHAAHHTGLHPARKAVGITMSKACDATNAIKEGVQALSPGSK